LRLGKMLSRKSLTQQFKIHQQETKTLLIKSDLQSHKPTPA
jgi:hypothetical protein